MTSIAADPRTAWCNKFERPEPENLLEPLGEIETPLAEMVREKFGAIKGVREDLGWLGLPWRWTFAYRPRRKGSEPFLYFVPDPERPRVCIRLDADVLCSIELEKLSRTARDALAGATRVGSRVWTEIELSSKAQADDAIDLAERAAALAL